MRLNIKKLVENAELPVVGDHNSIEFKCNTLGTGIGKDGRLVIEYKAGLSIEIPNGFIGLLSPLDGSYINSLLMPSSIVTMTEGWNEVVARFKINTDSVPSVFEQGEAFIKLVLVKSESFSFDEVESDTIKEEEKSEVAE